MRHLTYSDRIVISTLMKEGKSLTYIAGRIGFTKASVSKEVRRNTKDGQYDPEYAQQLAHTRSHLPKKKGKFTDEALIERVRECLAKNMSPEQIWERMKKEAKRDPEKTVVHYTTIYTWIDKGMFDNIDGKGPLVKAGKRSYRRITGVRDKKKNGNPE